MSFSDKQFNEFEIPDPEVALGMQLFAHAERLAHDDISTVIRGSLAALVGSRFYYAAEEKEIVLGVAAGLENAHPILRVTAGREYEDEPGPMRRRRPTGNLVFAYGIDLYSPDGPYRDRMGWDQAAGDLMALDGEKFSRAVGRVIVDATGKKQFTEAEIGPNPRVYVSDSDGQETVHPNPLSLFPHFTPAQKAELRAMALDTTDAFLDAYGNDPDVLQDKTLGLRWEARSSGSWQRWKDGFR
ncbi:MAG TPA: hypothetical protein VF733_05615 [Candidatus Saccharimonadales bacterium]